MNNVARIVLAAPHSGSGKTTITAGIIAAFTARGLRVAPFKVGPDYIDPTYHALAAGRSAHNLDAWMLPPERVRAVFEYRAHDSDVAIIEGVMGLFDGYAGKDDRGSTAHIARILDAPVLLVMDVGKMARTAAAIAKGLRDFDANTRVVGVLLNRVGSERHARMVEEAIQDAAGLPVVGYLKREDELYLPERHLGLIPTQEPGEWRAWLERVRARIEAHVNLDLILELARGAPMLRASTNNPFAVNVKPRAVIAVARDAAFSFLYQDNLDLLRAAGAELQFFSPLEDPEIPARAQGVYLCGGFPELYASQLAANETMRASIRAWHAAKRPLYAECGGLMYLTQEIVDLNGNCFPMVGALRGRSLMTKCLTMGYRTVRAARDNLLLRAGETQRGHEFHYSTWENYPNDGTHAYCLEPDALHPTARVEGARGENFLASYVHLHFLARPETATRFVDACAGEK